MPVGLLLLAIATALPSARPLPRRGIITAGAAACSAAMVGACPALDGLVLDGSTQEDERELEREEQEEKQMLTDLRKLRKVEQMEEVCSVSALSYCSPPRCALCDANPVNR